MKDSGTDQMKGSGPDQDEGSGTDQMKGSGPDQDEGFWT